VGSNPIFHPKADAICIGFFCGRQDPEGCRHVVPGIFGNVDKNGW
jgi:hypothetical protein